MRGQRAGGVGVAILLAGVTSVRADALMVSVASSLRDAVETIVANYRRDHPAVSITLNHGPSGMLARQIEDGAPVDVFLSAGWPEVDRLRAKALVGADPTVIARNGIVLVVPADSPWRGQTPRALLVAPDVARIASGDPAFVPVGNYAKQALTVAGLWESLAPKMIYATDVRQALTYADGGSVDAAIVYATDARIAKRAVLLGPVPGSEDLRIEVVAVRTRRSQADAGAFFAYLTSDAARDVLVTHGFRPPPP